MPMHSNGLSKLTGEIGEVIKVLGGVLQVVGKKFAYYHTDEHPDGAGSLKRRMEEELADARAAISFVEQTFELDSEFMQEREARKLATFQQWHQEE